MMPTSPTTLGLGHPSHDHDGGAGMALLPMAAVALVGAAYLILWSRGRRRNSGRGPGQVHAGFFLAGCALLAIAMSPPVDAVAARDFRGHMFQHLITGMYAPLALILGAPITVLLRAIRPSRARRVTRALRSRPLRVLAHPVTALTLSTGTLAMLYFTPLYNATMEHAVLHEALHLHFLASGCLFAWAIAGPDPAPGRISVPARLVVLGVAIAAHATISQLMYGGFLIDVHAPIAQVRGGAELMYYGGDIAEILLAAALVATWRPNRRTVRLASPSPASCVESDPRRRSRR